MPVLSQRPLKRSEIYAATIIVAFCSIVYELILAQSLSVIFGGNIIRYSVTIGLYLFGLGLGAQLLSYLLAKRPGFHFVVLEFVLAILGLLSIIGIFWFCQLRFTQGDWVFYAAHTPVLVLGILSGGELPLLTALARRHNFYRVLSLDYYGSLIGAVAFGVYMHTAFGLIATGIMVACLNMAVALYFMLRLYDGVWRYTVVTAACLVLGGVAVQHEPIRRATQDGYIKAYARDTLFHNNSDIPDNHINVNANFFTPYQWVTEINAPKRHKQKGDKAHHFDQHYILLDMVPQLAKRWIQPFHEGFALAGLAHARGDELNIAMGGDGDLLIPQKLLRSGRVAHIDHIDIDKQFVQYMIDHPFYSRFNSLAAKSPRMQTHYMDAMHFFRQRPENKPDYDIVYLDFSTLRENFKLLHLFSSEFYAAIKRHLADDGQIVMYLYNNNGFLDTLKANMKAAGLAHYNIAILPDFQRKSIAGRIVSFSAQPLQARRYSRMSDYQNAAFDYIYGPERIGTTQQRINSVFQANYAMVAPHRNKDLHPELKKLMKKTRERMPDKSDYNFFESDTPREPPQR